MNIQTKPNDLAAFWMPFSANRQFKKVPRLFVGAERMHYITNDGRRVLDGTSGLWCVNAGHCRPKIIEAIQQQAETLDFAGTFQMGHTRAFEAANRLTSIAPKGFDHVFFTNSGSESVETALKMAIAYHRAKGNGTKVRLIGRERGYHGVNFGGTSVGGIGGNRKMFGRCLPASIICVTRTIFHAILSCAASRSTASSLPMTWSASSRCTTRRRLRLSSSSRWPARRAS